MELFIISLALVVLLVCVLIAILRGVLRINHAIEQRDEIIRLLKELQPGKTEG